MAEESKIAWTHSTFNPWRGCQRVSPGCEHCYAETLSKRNHKLLGQWGPPASGGTRVVAAPSQWRAPLRWNAQAAIHRQQHRVFCSSLADVFEDLRDLDLPRQWLWRLIVDTPHLTWMLLTKRPQNIRNMVPAQWVHNAPEWPRNVWIGTTVEDQADERIQELESIPAPVRFLSVEPMLGPVSLDFLAWRRCSFCGHRGGCFCACPGGESFHKRSVDWVICGGESGPSARPFDLAWARSLRDQCAAAGVPFFFKQYGQNTVGLLEQPPRHLLDDQTWHAPDLRVRQFPEVRS